MSDRLVKSGRWNPPVGICGQGARSCTEDAEEVEDLVTDILSKSPADPGSDPGGGGGEGQVVPPPSSMGLWLGATGFATSGGVGMVALAMLACTDGAMAWVTSGAGTNGAVMGVRRQGIWRRWDPYQNRSH